MAVSHYVVSDKGRFGILYVNDHGYYFIVTPKKVYPSGKGFAKRWMDVKDEELPQEIRDSLSKAFERHKKKLEESKGE